MEKFLLLPGKTFVATDNKIYVTSGGNKPGSSVSNVNELLLLGRANLDLIIREVSTTTDPVTVQYASQLLVLFTPI